MRRTALRALWCAALAAGAVAAPAHAQRRPEPSPVAAAAFAPAALPEPASLRELARREWVRPLASLIIPGSGQLLAQQDRGMVYLAADLWFVARAVSLTSQGRRDRRAFQDLAFRVARARYTAVRRDGDFEYYETMTHFVESGVFDTDPGATFTPEPDTLTFNGATWLLARRTFFANPDSLPDPSSGPYQAALAFYVRRAVRDDFRWSWRDARLEQDVFRGQILASDDAFRTATNYFGAMVLNHLGSAIDALIAIRSGRRPAALPHLSPGSEPGAVHLYWNVPF